MLFDNWVVVGQSLLLRGKMTAVWLSSVPCTKKTAFIGDGVRRLAVYMHVGMTTGQVSFSATAFPEYLL